jgi:hypothetical protein
VASLLLHLKKDKKLNLKMRFNNRNPGANMKRFMKNRIIRLACALLLITLIFLAIDKKADALTITADPGSVGTSFFYKDFSFVGALNGTVLNGQTQSVDVMFSDNKFAVAGIFGIDLSINQSGDMGYFPINYSSVTGYLLDASGNPLNDLVTFALMGQMPTQIWPGWGYYLPDGTEYLPATTSYSASFSGNPINVDQWDNYYLDPIIFSGVHFDITYPDTPTETVMGLRMDIANYNTYYRILGTIRFIFHQILCRHFLFQFQSPLQCYFSLLALQVLDYSDCDSSHNV